MSKTRRAGRKTQLRRLLAQQYQVPRGENFLGIINYASTSPDLATLPAHEGYRMIPLTLESCVIDLTRIPVDDPRYQTYAEKHRMSRL